MSLRAGRVGVNPSDVDKNGHVKSAGDSYTKQQIDAKFETKNHIGGLQFRSDDGQAQYKVPNGEWTNFSSGGGDDGELLWENPSPSTFNGTAIPIENIAKYSKFRFVINSINRGEQDYIDCFIFNKRNASMLISACSEGSYITTRFVRPTNAGFTLTAVGSICNVTDNSSDPSVSNRGNGYCVPVRIYGIV